MRNIRKLAIASVSFWAISSPAFAQGSTGGSPDEAATSTSDIIVTARRKEESVQDVPLVVNAVTNQALEKLNIRELKDISSVVPGLSLVPNNTGTGSISTLRGINFDVNSSGNNGTVEFYLNDAPITSLAVLQSMYDIGQIEVLRGPQGTLRGRASPSGSITVTTRRPDLNEFGGYMAGTVNNNGGVNVNGAVNVPIVKGMLALRVAGLLDNNRVDDTRSINDPGFTPTSRSRSVRATLRFEPTDNIEIVGTFQHFVRNASFFDQMESANFIDSSQSASPIAIAPSDRLSVEEMPRVHRTAFNNYNLSAQWKFAGQKLNYVMEFSKTQLWAHQPQDLSNFFGSNYPGSVTAPNDPYVTGFATVPNFQNYRQFNRSVSDQQSHELRLSSDERLFGVVDYVIGGMINRGAFPFNLWSETPLFTGPASPAPNIFGVPSFNVSNIVQTGRIIEKSAFGNITVHLGSKTEISGGLRYIHYENNGGKTIQSSPAAPPTFLAGLPPLNENFNPVIYSASIKHRFNDNLMAYASTGSSWRASAQTNGIIDGISGADKFPFGNLRAVQILAPETSKSYEIGFKSDWLDKRMHVNLTYYHQDFKNYFYSAPLIQVAQRSALGPAGSLTGPNVGDTYSFATLAIIGVNIPVKVDGVEGEFAFQVTPDWNIGATASYSISKIKNAQVPCNVPAATPFFGVNAAAFVAANGNQQYGTCQANFRAGNTPPFTASLQSEYTHSVTDSVRAFIRGLATINGASLNDPTNPVDDVKAYTLFNLYLGVRGENGNWELTGYAKNLFNTQRVLTRDANPLATSYTSLAFTATGVVSTGLAGITPYRLITMTPEREFGLNLRVSFGSR